MSARSKSLPAKKISFIEQHRRAQIIDTAIETMAALGFAQASLANIAKAAGISKGVISYYFKGKDDLVQQIRAHLVADLGAFVKDRVASGGDLEKLHAYIDASLAYVRANRTKFVVMLDLGINLQDDDYGNPFSAINYQACRYRLEKILHEGQVHEAFPLFDTRTAAVLIQGAIDGICIQWVAEPETVDLENCRKEVTRMIDAYLGLGT